LDNKSELEFQINIARNELYELSKKVQNLTDPVLLSKSKELDRLINEYQTLMIYAESYIKEQ
jgi:Spo0E like sporulation regulatory protein